MEIPSCLSSGKLAGVGGCATISTQEPPAEHRSLPLSALGPLPSNASSEYVETLNTGVLVSWPELAQRFNIMLKPKASLPAGAYLEARFENPLDPNDPMVVGEVWQGTKQQILILSPELKGLKCWNYQVMVDIYSDESKEKLLGTHRQLIQSAANLDKVRGKAKTSEELVEMLSRGSCP